MRRFVRERAWFLPGCYVAAAVLLGVFLPIWDEHRPVSLDMDPATARQVMAAIGTGMIAFTGFVFSVVLFLVQFGSSAFSPRLQRWLRRDATVRHALGTFCATFIIALFGVAQVGSSHHEFVPTRTLLAVAAALVVSLAWFFALVSRTLDVLRVGRVAQALNRDARKIFLDVYPIALGDRPAPSAPLAKLAAPPDQVVTHDGVGEVVVSLDRPALVELARATDALIELVPAVGDHVTTGSDLVRVRGQSPLPVPEVRRAIAMGDERSLDDDPAFCFRLLVDVAIRALSPAVNDPGTAVQLLDRIEDLLRFAATRDLSVGRVWDHDDRLRLVFPTPSWDDLMTLALGEIRLYGATSLQVVRRLRALLVGLQRDLPDLRQAAVSYHLALLDETVGRHFTGGDLQLARTSDPQGVGAQREPASQWSAPSARRGAPAQRSTTATG